MPDSGYAMQPNSNSPLQAYSNLDGNPKEEGISKSSHNPSKAGLGSYPSPEASSGPHLSPKAGLGSRMHQEGGKGK